MRKPVGGQVVVITGAARGVGALPTRVPHRRGAKVVPVGLESAELAEVAAGLDTTYREGPRPRCRRGPRDPAARGGR